MEHYREGVITSNLKEFRDMVLEAAKDPSIDNIRKAIVRFKRIRKKMEQLAKKLNVPAE